MKLRFNGIIDKQKKGCKPCGRSKGETVYVRTKRYYLPSGTSITFRSGDVEEVSDTDADFLLSYTYKDPSGVTKHVFEVA